MRFYEIIQDGYILAIGTGNGGTEITESEYNTILEIIHNKPPATETTDYRLRTDLTWEEHEVLAELELELDNTDKVYDISIGGIGIGNQ